MEVVHMANWRGYFRHMAIKVPYSGIIVRRAKDHSETLLHCPLSNEIRVKVPVYKTGRPLEKDFSFIVLGFPHGRFLMSASKVKAAKLEIRDDGKELWQWTLGEVMARVPEVES